MRKLLIATLLPLAFACASSDQGAAKPQPHQVGMSLDEARSLVAALEKRQADANATDPLRAPKNLDDVLAILKRDQLDLFPAGVDFASKQADPKAKALESQIELAWGESHLILSELFGQASARLKDSVRALQTRSFFDQPTDEEKKQIEEYKKVIAQCDTIAEALNLLAREHVGRGAKIAQDLIAANPNDYLGYRLAADYYRMRGDWANFDVMLQKIEQTNPESNGLLFLKGAGLMVRDRKLADATVMFRKALEKDPQFTRAQAHLVLMPTDPIDTYQEFEKLRQISPNHQIVVWAGPAITAAYNAATAARTPRGGTARPTTDQGPKGSSGQ